MLTPSEHDADWHWLRHKAPPAIPDGVAPLRVVDLFCGCGGMTVGLAAAAAELGMPVEVALAVDLDPHAVRVFKHNLGGAAKVGDVAAMFPGKRNQLTKAEQKLADELGRIDVLLGGPPCQGHSDLNNHTRRDDPRNALYATMGRAARVLRPRAVVIENVVAVTHDRTDVVGRTRAELESLGYSTVDRVFGLDAFGMPQTRRRHLMIATAPGVLPAESLVDALLERTYENDRTVRWAIEDLLDIEPERDFDQPSAMHPDNEARAKYLVRYKQYDLPDDRRPPCHRDKEHSYVSAYGRLHWDKPAQTITTGFTSMGQGRYVHPARPRTLTPHEAARIQTFPDYFSFDRVGRRTSLSKLIGNAVPPLTMRRIGELLLEYVAPPGWRSPVESDLLTAQDVRQTIPH